MKKAQRMYATEAYMLVSTLLTVWDIMSPQNLYTMKLNKVGIYQRAVMIQRLHQQK